MIAYHESERKKATYYGSLLYSVFGDSYLNQNPTENTHWLGLASRLN